MSSATASVQSTATHSNTFCAICRIGKPEEINKYLTSAISTSSSPTDVIATPETVETEPSQDPTAVQEKNKISFRFCMGRSTGETKGQDKKQKRIVDEVDQREYTGLMCAIENENAQEAVRQLILMHGADVNYQTPITRLTPLHLACKEGNAYAAQLLLEVGANPTLTDISGRNMLHYAAIGLNGKVIRRLVEQTSAELLDAPDLSGYTPFLVATEHGNFDAVKLMLRCGADCNKTTKLKHNAVELADWYGHMDIYRYLITMRGFRPKISEKGQQSTTTSSSAATKASCSNSATTGNTTESSSTQSSIAKLQEQKSGTNVV